MSLLTDGKLASTIATALGGIVYPITIRRTSASTYTPGVGTVPGTTTDHIGKGFVGSFSPQEVIAGIVKATDVKITILTSGLDITPDPSLDKIVTGGKILTIIAVSADAARATFTIQCR